VSSRASSSRADPTVSPEAALAQLARILASPVFSGAERLRRFLRFSVESAVEAGAPLPKERTIGLAVYDRGETYDPRVDPIVRVEAARLRSKLREYYETAGREDAILIAVAKGSYAAQIRLRGPDRAAGTPVARPPSIAVLPFSELGATAGEDYFGDGLTEELIHTLGRIAGLRVVARTSVFAFKGRTLDVREIGRRLDVATLLEGSVRRADGRLRVTARLVDVGDGCELWTEAYDREAADLLLLQQELAASIAATLRLQLAPDRPIKPVPLEARDLYLRGRHFYVRRTPADARRALELFMQAAAYPDHAAALAGVANCHGLLAYWEIERDENLPRAVAAARQALAIAPDLAEAYIPLALSRIQTEWDWAGAERELRTAIALDPAAPEAQHLYAHLCLLPTGRVEEAVVAIRLALTLDPLSPPLHASLGRALTLAGRHEEAIDALQGALELVPDFREARWQLALALEQAGRFGEALRCFEQAGALAPGVTDPAGGIGHCLAVSGQRDAARRLLAAPLPPGPRALILLGLAERDAAVDQLEEAARARSRLLMWLKVDPRFRPLHGHPRFESLRASVGLA